MSKFLSLLFFMMSLLEGHTIAKASTFVGNGGNVLDFELKNTLKRVEQAALSAKVRNDLCQCSFSSDECKELTDLNQEKSAFCKRLTSELAPQILEILDRSKAIQFIWSSEALNTEDSASKRDAIVEKSREVIHIDENRFANMSEAQRIQLMTHELLHLVKWQGSLLNDEAHYGPYQGRDLLDTLGVAYAAEAMKSGSIQVDKSSRSRPFYHYRLAVDNGSALTSKAFAKESFVDSTQYQTSGLTLFYFSRVGDNLGLAVNYNTFDMSGTLHEVKGSIHSEIVHAGAAYRFLPFESSYRFFNSFMVSLYVGAGGAQTRHAMSDDFDTITAKVRSYAIVSSINLDVPLIYNFWFTVGKGVFYTPYEIKNLGIKKSDFSFQTTMGITYAF